MVNIKGTKKLETKSLTGADLEAALQTQVRELIREELSKLLGGGQLTEQANVTSQPQAQQQGQPAPQQLSSQQLAQAHLENSEQLANNLLKLKQVIAETQQIAHRMELILAQEEKRTAKETQGGQAQGS
jgi:hypothetical protein